MYFISESKIVCVELCYYEAKQFQFFKRGRPAQQFDENQQLEDAEVEEYSTEEDGTVVTQLSHRVQDGTRCRPGSLDMCIHGKCQVS